MDVIINQYIESSAISVTFLASKIDIPPTINFPFSIKNVNKNYKKIYIRQPMFPVLRKQFVKYVVIGSPTYIVFNTLCTH